MSLPDIRTVDFRNFTYPADSCPTGGFADPPAAGFPLRDGLFRDDLSSSVGLNEGQVVYGDVTGDGHDDAAVPLTCSTGVGSGTITHPWIFTPDATSATKVRRLPYPALTETQLTQLGLPDYYPKYAEPTITSGTLTLAWWTIPRPFDPPKIVTTHQRWDGSAWRTTSPPTVTDGNPSE